MHSYRFSNLLGATYRGGNVQFTPDGNTLLSPVGNRVNAVDLVQGRCFTLAPETPMDIRVLALTPDTRLLLSIDVQGRAVLVNFIRSAVLCRINFKTVVHSARWSPDGRWLAVTHGRLLQTWRTPTLHLGWQFVMHRKMGGHHDELIDLAWAPNSLFLATCAKDMAVRLHSLHYGMENFEPISVVEHRSPVRSVFFSADMRYLHSLSRDGILVTIRYDLKEVEKGPEQEEGLKGDEGPQEGMEKERAGSQASKSEKPLYCRPGKWTLMAKAKCQQPSPQKVMRCAFDAPSRLFAAGFTGGIFMLFEMPELQALQTLSLGTHALDTVALGANGDWLAVGSAEVGQLLVWEWRSETYVLKQQGHHWGVQCVAFSLAGGSGVRRQKALTTMEGQAENKTSTLAGRLLATGGYDGKIKVFSARSGLCFVTFAEHTAPVVALCFTPQGNAIMSASRDGSVRAYDLLRYRNFRTFACPDGLAQFASLAVDAGGEIVAASATGGKYAIYVWSIQTGNVLEVLSAHTSEVMTLQFSPSARVPGQLVSGGWDGKLIVWDLYANKGAVEPLLCHSAVTSLAFDPRGNDLCAAACLAGQVLFWNVGTGQQEGSIEGLRDIQSARQWHDAFAASHSKHQKGTKTAQSSTNVNLNQHFNSIAYARGGELLLCSSKNAPHVCLYDTTSYMLASRVTLTTNRSLSGVQMMLNSARLTKDGISLDMLDLSDSDADDVEFAKDLGRRRQASALPGVNVGEAKDMYTERELHVWGVAFSSDSQQFAVATTHGVFVYSAEMGLGAPTGSAIGSEAGRFVPQMLTRNVSGPAVLKALEAKDLSKAMILALALNDHALLRQVYESVPVATIPVVIASIGSPLLPALLSFISYELKPTTGSPHFQFHVNWINALVDLHFLTLLELSSGKATARTGTALEAAATSRTDVAALCLQLLVELSERHATMAKTFESNRYLLRYLGAAPVERQGEEPPEAAAKGPEPSVARGVATDAAKAEQPQRRKQREEPVAAQEAPAAEDGSTGTGPSVKKKKKPSKLAQPVEGPPVTQADASAPAKRKKRRRQATEDAEAAAG